MIQISPADFRESGLLAFLQEHLDDMAPTAPAESRHALNPDALQGPGIRTWMASERSVVVGTIALATLSDRHEELKSMRTDPARRGEGIASSLLNHALEDARSRGTTRVSLETGSMDFFAPARALYRRAGFENCAPFGTYIEDPNSVFMTRVSGQ